MVPAFVTLSHTQVAAVERRTGLNVRWTQIERWRTSDRGSLLVDAVAGKYYSFTIAVGMNADGSVRQIEVHDYYDSYGPDVRNDVWRGHFLGTSSTEALVLTDDIKSICGAALSCRHVTNALRRLLAIYDIALRSS